MPLREAFTIYRHGLGMLVRVRDGGIGRQNAAALQAEVLAAWEAGGAPRRIVVDLAGGQPVDSSGIGVLVALARRAGEAGVPFAVCGVAEGLRQRLERMGLSRAFEIAGTMEEALLGIPPSGMETAPAAAVTAEPAPGPVSGSPRTSAAQLLAFLRAAARGLTGRRRERSGAGRPAAAPSTIAGKEMAL